MASHSNQPNILKVCWVFLTGQWFSLVNNENDWPEILLKSSVKQPWFLEREITNVSYWIFIVALFIFPSIFFKMQWWIS
jgi:hypothetical protein